MARRLTGLDASEDGDRRRRSPRVALLFAVAATVVLVALLVTQVLVPRFEAPPEPSNPAGELVASFAEVGFALETWRAREGTYPARIEQLVPGELAAIPADPFHPEYAPLRYEAGESELGTVVLYSVGPDGHDDGGHVQDLVSGRGDLVYPVW